MENTGNGAKAPEKNEDQSTAESLSSSAPNAKRSTASVSLADRLAILQSAVNALAPYGVETGASEIYADGRLVVAIYLVGVHLHDGKLCAINGSGNGGTP